MITRVHFVHFSTQPGGIEVLLPILIKKLQSVIFNSFVLRPSEKNKINIYCNIAINIVYGEKGIKAYWKLLKYAITYREDIFHVFNIGPIALFILRIAGVKKLIYAIHGTIYWKTRNQRMYRKHLWRFAMKPQYFISSNSAYSGNVFVKNVLKTAKPLLIYNPIDSNRFKKLDNRNSNIEKLKIVYSGRLAPGKNLFRWISIANYIYKKHPGYRFEIYGDGPLKQGLQNLILDNNLEDIITVKGFCRNAEEIYQNADLLLFLSEYESFGNVVVESILCETPVITGAIPSMKEIFQNFSEFLVNLDDDLEQNIMLKIEQIENLRLLAKNAAQEFREIFSLEQHIRKVEIIYDSFNS
jgi:glycosyltransferase involved in cell wall biosynthesis